MSSSSLSRKVQGYEGIEREKKEGEER